jgi:hypothetical protein
MAWVKDLGKATLAYWWALMSCAASSILGLYALVFQKDNHWLVRSSFIFAGVFIIVAIALAWRDEHRKLLTELERNSYPEFQVEVSRLFHDVTPIQGIAWLHCGNIYVAKLCLVNIRPSPSSVQGVYVTLDDQDKKFSAKPFDVTQLTWQKQKFAREFLGQTITEYSTQQENIRDLLPSLIEPMTRGLHKDGWVYLSGLPKVDSSESFRFYVVDAYGKSHGPFISKAEMDVANVAKPRAV